jgi:HAD superfamily hydrolase (TIGR01509 family)
MDLPPTTHFLYNFSAIQPSLPAAPSSEYCMIKAVFWDNDGVLVATEHLYYQASAEILSTFGIELSPQVFAEISLRRGESVLDLAVAAGCPPAALEQLRRKRNERYAELLRHPPQVLAGVAETLSTLSGKVRQGVVTSCRRDHFDIIHGASGLAPFFDFVLTREDYQQSKPHPEPYLTALRHCGLHADECLVVEDTERGLRAALAAGLRCVVIPGPLTDGANFSGATAMLSGAHEVLAEVARL